MSPIIIEIIAALLALLAGGSTNLISKKLIKSNDETFRVFERAIKKFFGVESEESDLIFLGIASDKSEDLSYSTKINKLTQELVKSSEDVDTLIKELSEVAKEREASLKEKEENLKKIENDLLSLQNREKELKETIEELEKTSPKVAEYFAQLTSQGETKSAKRDYLLFGAGVVVSTAITILLKLVFGI